MNFEKKLKIRKIINPITEEEILLIGNFIIREGDIRYHYIYFRDINDKTNPTKIVKINPLDEKNTSNVLLDEYLKACHGNADLIRSTLVDFTNIIIATILTEIKGTELYTLNLENKDTPLFIVDTIMKDCGIKKWNRNPDDTRFILAELLPGDDNEKYSIYYHMEQDNYASLLEKVKKCISFVKDYTHPEERSIILTKALMNLKRKFYDEDTEGKEPKKPDKEVLPNKPNEEPNPKEPNPKNPITAYDFWLAEGNTGSKADFVESMKGKKPTNEELEVLIKKILNEKIVVITKTEYEKLAEKKEDIIYFIKGE